MVFLAPRRVSPFSRGVIFTRARVSLALLYLMENEGLLVVDVDKLGKICRHHWKERLKMSKIAKLKVITKIITKRYRCLHYYLYKAAKLLSFFSLGPFWS